MKNKNALLSRCLILSLMIFASIFYTASALETGSKIHSGEALIGIRESYGLYQGYGIRIAELSSDNKMLMDIYFEGEPIKKNEFIRQNEVYRYTRVYEGKTYLIFTVTLIEVDTDDWIAKLIVNQYLDPSLPASGFLIIDRGETIEQGKELILNQDFRLKLKEIEADSAIFTLYKRDIKVKEQEVSVNENFNYSISMNGKEFTLITFELGNVFEGATRNAAFIEHLFQFEGPLKSSPQVNVTAFSRSNNSGNSRSREIVVNYTLSGSPYFNSGTISLDDQIIEMMDITYPGTYTMVIPQVTLGTHHVNISVISDEGAAAKGVSEIDVQRSYSPEVRIPKISLPDAGSMQAPALFIATLLLIIVWAAIRGRGRNKWN